MAKYQLIIAGSRSITSYSILEDAIDRAGLSSNIKTVISGGARGADALGEKYAASHNIPIMQFLADWDYHGKKAGNMRNAEMAMEASKDNGACLILWDGQSRGSLDMFGKSIMYGLLTYLFYYESSLSQPLIVPARPIN